MERNPGLSIKMHQWDVERAEFKEAAMSKTCFFFLCQTHRLRQAAQTENRDGFGFAHRAADPKRSLWLSKRHRTVPSTTLSLSKKFRQFSKSSLCHLTSAFGITSSQRLFTNDVPIPSILLQWAQQPAWLCGGFFVCLFLRLFLVAFAPSVRKQNRLWLRGQPELSGWRRRRWRIWRRVWGQHATERAFESQLVQVTARCLTRGAGLFGSESSAQRADCSPASVHILDFSLFLFSCLIAAN